MDENDIVLLLKYPLVSKTLEENCVVYKGSIHVNDEDYQISITELNNSDFKVFLPERLTNLKPEFDAIVVESQPKNVVTVLDCLVSFIESKVPTLKLVDHCEGYKHVLSEYSDFTRFYLNIKSCRLAHDLSKIKISTLDEGNREHSFEVSINFDDKDLFNITSFDLPQDGDIFKKSSSLKDIYDQFLRILEQFQPYFDIVDAFDANCWVLDPEKPRRSCTYRRIWIKENFSVVITFNAMDVFKMPEIKFLGPERLVEEHRKVLNDNIGDWEPENGVFSEILKLLGLESFPQRPAEEERRPDVLVESGDCSICFSSRLNEKLPDVICKNTSCENSYHAECLYEWLMSVNARRFYSEVVGLCPNCEKNISCPIPK